MPRGPPPPRPPPIFATPPSEPPPPYPGPPVELANFVAPPPPPPYPHGPTRIEYLTPGQSNQTELAASPTHTDVTEVIEHQSFTDRTPMNIQCPSCCAEILTTVLYKTTSLQWALCIAICFVGGCLGCCLIPFFIDGLGDMEHVCPNCKCVISKGPASMYHSETRSETI